MLCMIFGKNALESNLTFIEKNKHVIMIEDTDINMLHVDVMYAKQD